MILIANIYRPPQGNIDNFTQVLENILINLELTKIELFIMGDLNIDMLDKKNISTKRIIELLKPFGLRQLIKSPTRYSNDKNSILDVIFTNSDFISNSGVGDVNLSDHQMILTTRKKVKIQNQKCAFTGRSYRNYNKDVFQISVADADWTTFDNENTVTSKWKEMEKIIRGSIDVMCPIKEFRIKQVKEQWVTPPLLELIKDKDSAMKKAKRKGDPELWKIAKDLRNRCTKRLREARAEYIKDKLKNNMGNSKKFWKNIQEVLPNKKSKDCSFNLFESEKGEMVKPEKTADFINEYFTGIGPKLAQQYNSKWSFNGTESDEIMDDVKSDLIEITRLCNDININKSSGVEHLSSEILRDAFLAVPIKVVELFNMSFDTSEIPDEWKIAKVTPLP